MLGYDSLSNHFKTNFTLMHEHKYSLAEIENMMVWEKFVYVDMLKQYIKHQEDTKRDLANQAKHQMRKNK